MFDRAIRAWGQGVRGVLAWDARRVRRARGHRVGRACGGRLLVGFCLLVFVVLCLPAFAWGAGSPGAGLTVHSVAFQGEFPEGVAHTFQVSVANAGSEATSGPVVVKDKLPVGFTVTVREFTLPPGVVNGLVDQQGAENIEFELEKGNANRKVGARKR